MSDDSDSISFLARQREASQQEEQGRERTAEFYDALIDGDTERIYDQFGISPPSVKVVDGVRLIDDPELERNTRELDALPEPDLRRLIFATRDDILRRIDQSDVISSTLKDGWQRSLRSLLGNEAPGGLFDLRLPTELILGELGRLRSSIEDEHTTARMRAGEGGNLWTSVTRERMVVDSEFQPVERDLSDLVYLLTRYRFRFGRL
jgi:hypothetical protein